MVERYQMVPTEEIDKDYEAIMKSSTKYTTKQELRIRKLIESKFSQMQFVNNTTMCEIGGDQTTTLNLNILEAQLHKHQTSLEELQANLKNVEEQMAHIEVESLPEETQREIKRIKNQLSELRAGAVPHLAGMGGPTYVAGHSHADDRNKPDIADYALGYSIDGTKDVHGELQDELKNKFREMGLVDDEPVVEVDAGFGEIPFDPNKCREPILKDGQLSQCARYPDAGSKYCWQHKKKYEDRQFT